MSDPAQNSGVLSQLRSSFSSTNPATTTGSDTLNDALTVADQVLTSVESTAQASQPVATAVPTNDASVLPQVIPTVVQQTTDTLNPAYAGPTAKESLEGIGSSLDIQAPDASGGVQYVEQEHHAEIPVEVESFLQQVDDHQAQLPTEIVIADGTMPVPQPNFPTHKVVVLPITPQVEEMGEKKNPSWSVKWLVEWSHKIMKMFTGDVIYRQN
jgi:hypothetical protein